MKSILRIIIRYILGAVFIAFTVLIMNFIVFLYCMSVSGYMGAGYLDFISQGFYTENDTVQLSGEAFEKLEENYKFAMLLNEQGDIIWSHDLPQKLEKHYTVKDIASLSKWYVEDYPVWSWNCKSGLMIVGREPHSIWKMNMEYSTKSIKLAMTMMPICNLVFIGALALFFGWRFYRSLKPVAQGIEDLSLKKRTRLPANGIMGDLKEKISHTSEILEKQDALLARRDNARTEWISGVSHDIRTPLSMIMGYADALENDGTLSREQMEKAAIIKKQSVVIKELIEDLNMTSKLEYEMQPLRLEECNLSALLRQLVADYYNQDLDEKYEIELLIAEEAQKMTIQADRTLLTRAFRNLIGNSLGHNPQGCHISINVKAMNQHYFIVYEDSGKGISQEVIEAFSKTAPQTLTSPHIMGLYLVQKIILCHNGTFKLIDTKGQGMRAMLYL